MRRQEQRHPVTARLTQLPEYAALSAHHAELASRHLRALFAEDPERAQTLCAEACGIYLDYSKNRLTAETLDKLIALAEATGLRGRIEAMFRGDKINVTEQRAVLHTALRAPEDAVIEVDGVDVVPEV